jgi:hypothetical protein
MLFGADLHIHTDHRNLLNVGDSSECRLRWISYADEYGTTLHYVEGPLNVITDTLSRLSRNAYCPDNFSSLVPLFNHITSRVMYYCSIAFTKSV